VRQRRVGLKPHHAEMFVSAIGADCAAGYYNGARATGLRTVSLTLATSSTWRTISASGATERICASTKRRTKTMASLDEEHAPLLLAIDGVDRGIEALALHEPRLGVRVHVQDEDEVLCFEIATCSIATASWRFCGTCRLEERCYR
jgi:hypothetical protein